MSDQATAKPDNSKSLACFRNQLLVLSFALLMISQSVGCSSISRLGFGEAIAVGYRDLVWAKRAYNLRFGNCDRPYAEHFQNGFCSGYTDVCHGGDGYVPALPPAEYRGFEFQSIDGSQCVNSWFEGYPAGVAAAKQDKAGNFHDVMISRMVNSAIKQEKAKPVLPQDVPIVGARDAYAPVPVVKSTGQSFTAPPAPAAPPAPKLTPTGLPPIISGSAMSVSPVRSGKQILEPAKPKIPQIVPASFSNDASNTPLPMAVSDKPWNSSRK